MGENSQGDRSVEDPLRRCGFFSIGSKCHETEQKEGGASPGCLVLTPPSGSEALAKGGALGPDVKQAEAFRQLILNFL